MPPLAIFAGCHYAFISPLFSLTLFSDADYGFRHYFHYYFRLRFHAEIIFFSLMLLFSRWLLISRYHSRRIRRLAISRHTAFITPDAGRYFIPAIIGFLHFQRFRRISHTDAFDITPH